ncbi:ABC transporter permease subunit [Longispora sp. NPDC051575]|uniref:ABC transporter permease subunit n=1 Tax=Longispora sp. NPDC051575 TaxID=3154943 RepID=UPI00343B8D7A
MIVARRMLADRRRATAWWAIGTAALVVFTVALYPAVKDQAQVEDLLKTMPEAFRNMIGYDAAVPMTSPAGYLHARLFSTVAPVLFLVFGIGAGAAAIGGLEETGRLEPLLANPVTRARVAAERYAAAIGLLTLLGVVFAVTLAASGRPAGALAGISAGHLIAAAAAMLALAVLHLSLAYAIGAATGRRGPSVAIPAAVAIGSYLIHSLLPMAEALAPVRYALPWYWYLQRNILAQGLPPAALIAPLAMSGVLFAIGWAAFQRRDLR